MPACNFSRTLQTPKKRSSPQSEDRLHHVAQSVRRKAPVRRLANRLTELIANLSFKAEAAKPGYLSIAPLSRAGYTNRAHIYITGMDEATFPGGATEDPILLDGERSGVSGELELRRTRPAEQVWHLIRVLGMASNKVTLLSCHRSLSDGQGTLSRRTLSASSRADEL